MAVHDQSYFSMTNLKVDTIDITESFALIAEYFYEDGHQHISCLSIINK